MKQGNEPVSNLMSTPIVALDPETQVAEALRLSESLSIHHFPLIDRAGLLGIVCTCDLESARPEQAVSQFAQRPAVTLPPQAKMHEAAARMMAHGVGSVVIADDEGVWGILTRDDLAQLAPSLMQNVHCATCNSRQHLRPGRAHRLICAACDARQRTLTR